MLNKEAVDVEVTKGKWGAWEWGKEDLWGRQLRSTGGHLTLGGKEVSAASCHAILESRVWQEEQNMS